MEKKNIILICVSILVIVGLFFASSIVNKKEKENEDKYKNQVVEIKVKDYGSIIVSLDYDNAPITVKNFIQLVEDKFYDGLTFHRIIDGFMIQGGSFDEDGNKKDAKTIKGEFTSNGVDNKISHTRGVISMARATDPNSGSSGFFIVHEDYPSLDGQYTAFGKVLTGMDVVDRIVEDSNPIDDNGGIELEDRPIIESIRLVPKVNAYEE